MVVEDPCDRCLFTSCCTESLACLNTTSCSNLVNCLGLCNGAPACQTTCANNNAAGVTLLNAVGRCSTANCSNSCAPLPPAVGGSPAPITQAVGKFCNGLNRGGNPTTMELFVGTLRLIATTGTCSTVITQPCTPLPTGQVQVRLTLDGETLDSASHTIIAGKGYVFYSALEDNLAVLGSLNLDSAASCAGTFPPNSYREAPSAPVDRPSQHDPSMGPPAHQRWEVVPTEAVRPASDPRGPIRAFDHPGHSSAPGAR